VVKAHQCSIGDRRPAHEFEFHARKSVDYPGRQQYQTDMFQLPDRATMYQALLERDRSYDGVFMVAVKTTGVFCRPICRARKPRQENVEFFATSREALHAGYRPCKRCRPMDATGRPPHWVERLLDRVEQAPNGRLTDADLLSMSIEPGRARRYFKEHYGMTFHAYHRARRMGRALAELRGGQDLQAVGLRHGFESASGFRDAFARVFGTPPGRGRWTRRSARCWWWPAKTACACLSSSIGERSSDRSQHCAGTRAA
jgi:methylphosphotriester-DNA--protein-cysteine methyltransferase